MGLFGIRWCDDDWEGMLCGDQYGSVKAGTAGRCDEDRDAAASETAAGGLWGGAGDMGILPLSHPRGKCDGFGIPGDGPCPADPGYTTDLCGVLGGKTGITKADGCLGWKSQCGEKHPL